MSHVNKAITSGTPLPPAIPTSFVTDSGTAIPAANILNVLGGAGCSTSGSGSTVTIIVDGTAPSYVNVTFGMSPYAVTSTDYFISCDSSGGPITIRLLDAPTTYDQFVVKDRTGNSATNNITITTVGGAVLIDGATTQILDDAYDSLELLFNSTSYESF